MIAERITIFGFPWIEVKKEKTLHWVRKPFNTHDDILAKKEDSQNLVRTNYFDSDSLLKQHNISHPYHRFRFGAAVQHCDEGHLVPFEGELSSQTSFRHAFLPHQDLVEGVAPSGENKKPFVW